MRILHICLCGQFNETFSYQDNLLTKYHSLSGHDVYIIAPTLRFSDDGTKLVDLKQPSVVLLPNNIYLYRVKYKYILPRIINDRLRIYSGVEKLLEEIKPNFIFIHGVQFLDGIIVKRFLEKYPEIIAVADNHADENNSLNNFLSKYFLHGFLWKRIAHKLNSVCKTLYGVTPNRVEFLHDYYNIPREDIKLLPLAADNVLIEQRRDLFDRDSLLKKYNLASGKIIIVTGGKIDIKKNFGNLVDALSKIENSNNIELVIFGSYVDPEIESAFEKFTFVKNVGWKSQKDIIDLFLLSDIICFPGSHSVLWEQAVACGKPTIFNTIQGMTHISINGNAILVNGNSVLDLKTSLSKLLSDKELLLDMKNRAEEICHEFYYSTIAERALNCE